MSESRSTRAARDGRTAKARSSRGRSAARGADGPAIGEYGLIGDCHSAALVSRAGSIDWCCLPRFDSGSCFARLLDAERGGHCSIALRGAATVNGSSVYLEDTLVLQTTLESRAATVRVLDFFAMREGGRLNPRHELVRIIECERGSAELELTVAPRFDYGAVQPWLRRMGTDVFSAIGGDDGLLVWSDHELDSDDGALSARGRIGVGERRRLVLRSVRPHLLEEQETSTLSAPDVDARLEEAIEWWRRFRARVSPVERAGAAVVRSSLTLKAMTYAPTGAIVAAPTTSLPEAPAGKRNWDYRFSWIRDSTLAAYALAELGCEREAARFRHFTVRSSAGRAEDLQIMFGVGGERRVGEEEVDLAGYRGARPVRVGNAAVGQLQLDAYGEILNLAWRWHRRGHSPDDDEWRFFADVAEMAAERWQEPDRGIWEWRGQPRHFVHSKAACWVALDHGLKLAEECNRRAPVRRWRKARKEIMAAIDEHGYDPERGVFVQCFDEPELDAALLLLPVMEYIEFGDERMVRTADAIRRELDADGFLYRYRRKDDLPGKEGAFIPCSFWLAECYARQGRLGDAREVYDRAMGAASPLGLFSEEIEPASGELLGNYPQALSHLSQVAAAMAMAEAGADAEGSAG